MTDSIAFSGFWASGQPILQRSLDNNICWVYLTGTYSGTQPDEIDAQLINASTTAVIQPWTPLEMFTVGNGMWAGLMSCPPNAALMQWQARMHRETGVTANSVSFGCGDVIVITGQSNGEMLANEMSGVSPIALNIASGIYIQEWEFSGLSNYSSAGLTNPYNWLAPLGDGIITLANLIGAVTGYAVGFIFTNRTGTPLCKDSAVSSTLTQYLASEEGSPFNAPLEGYWQATEMGLRAACAGLYGNQIDFSAMLHIHGEADSFLTSSAKYIAQVRQYYQNLLGLVTTYRTPLQCPFIMPVVGKYGGAGSPRLLVGIAQAMRQACYGQPGMIASADRYDYTPLNDGVHLTATECQSFARRLSPDLIANIGAGGYRSLVASPGAGPYIQNATINGATIVANINLNGHSGVVAAGGPTGLTGFQVSTVAANFGSTLSINSAVLNASATPPNVTITLASTPNGPVRLEYDMTSYSPSPPDNIIYSTDFAPGDAKGFPLQLTSRAIDVISI